MNKTIEKKKTWRRVGKPYCNWDQADAVRQGIHRDSPRMDVRLTPWYGQFIVEIRDD